jgi:3-hydroxyisobutyrate dehydrogenase-like beta-hydroxyacid dehydrogenase
VQETLRGSALYAKQFDKKLQKMMDRDYANPNFPTKHLLKASGTCSLKAWLTQSSANAALPYCKTPSM